MFASVRSAAGPEESVWGGVGSPGSLHLYLHSFSIWPTSERRLGVPPLRRLSGSALSFVGDSRFRAANLSVVFVVIGADQQVRTDRTFGSLAVRTEATAAAARLFGA